MTTLINKDIELFYLINGLRNPFLDYFLAFMSHNLSFVIFILSATIFLTIKKYRKHFWILIIAVALSFLLADRISVMCFKDIFQRLRPSHCLDGVYLIKLSNWELIRNYKGGLYGFVSSHAANAFSLATIFAFFGRKYKFLPTVSFLWAIVVGYSRIYCGVHFPSDVFVGGILGIIIGIIIIFICRFLEYRFLKYKYIPKN